MTHSNTNERLKNLGQEFTKYSKLIDCIIDQNDDDVKYNLIALLMNNGSYKITINSLRDRLSEIYKSDKNINEYIDKIISRSPKLGSIDIYPLDKADSRNNYTACISVRCNYNDSRDIVNREIKNIKEVLRIILLESKFISK